MHKFTAKELVVPKDILHGLTRRTSSLARNANQERGPGSDRSAWPPITSYNNNNRPHEGFLTVRSPDRGPRTRERERKRERRRGARRHTLLMWHETWRQNHQIRETSCAFPRVTLSDHVCGDLAIWAGPFWGLGSTPTTQ